MRNLFLLLLMANLVFAMWWLWVEPTDRPADPAPAADAQAPRLLLVSEVDAMLAGETEAQEVAGLALAAPEPIVAGEDAVGDSDDVDAADAGGLADAESAATTTPDSGATLAAEATEATVGVAAADEAPPIADSDSGAEATGVASVTGEASGAVTVAASEIPTRCVSVGPFLDLAEATVAASTLRSGGLEPRQRLAESQVLAGYWVHLPAYPSRAAAISAVEGLRENGVTDIYIEPSGEQRNAVSLGIFSDRARAESHASNIRAIDFGAVVSERFRPAQAYWVDVDLAASFPASAFLDTHVRRRRTAQTRRIDRSVDTSGLSSTASADVRVEEGACGE